MCVHAVCLSGVESGWQVKSIIVAAGTFGNALKQAADRQAHVAAAAEKGWKTLKSSIVASAVMAKIAREIAVEKQNTRDAEEMAAKAEHEWGYLRRAVVVAATLSAVARDAAQRRHLAEVQQAVHEHVVGLWSRMRQGLVSCAVMVAEGKSRRSRLESLAEVEWAKLRSGLTAAWSLFRGIEAEVDSAKACC